MCGVRLYLCLPLQLLNWKDTTASAYPIAAGVDQYAHTRKNYKEWRSSGKRITEGFLYFEDEKGRNGVC